MSQNETNNGIVLVVDDSPDSLGMLNSALSEAQFTTLVALSGKQALSILEKLQADIILLDAMMPHMDGFETCKIMKHLYPNIPVIFMTGLSEVENIVKGFDAGVTDYIVKPINPNEVIARIKAHLITAQLANSARDALDWTGQHILAVNAKGEILWGTEHAKNLLNNDNDQANIDAQISEWLITKGKLAQLVLTNTSKPLIIHFLAEQNKDEYLLKLSLNKPINEKANIKKNLGITPREADVLLWLSRGKTNWEISKILNISDRTVNKHLEQVYKKIEVNNRTAAAAKAIEAINNSNS